jgi:hypothetical protein
MSTIGPIGFKGGYNSRASIMTIEKDQLTDGQNVRVIYGDLIKINGSVKLNAAAFASGAAFHGLTDWQTAAGQRYLVGTAGTKIGQMSDLNGTWTDITGAVTITTGANNLHTFASLNNILAICGGIVPDAPIQWTGTGNASVLTGSPPTGSLVAVANNFMFISGIAATPSRTFWSNVGDPNTWGVGNYVDFRVSDGDKVTAITDLNQNLIIFKRNSIGQLWTIPPSSAVSTMLGPLTQIKVGPGVGCPGPLAVDKIPGGILVFMATNGHVYIFDGSTLQDISDKPSPEGNVQPTFDAINVGRLPYVVVRYYASRNQIWISFATGSNVTNNRIMVYDLSYGIWNPPMVGFNANVMSTVLDTRASPSHPVVMVTGNYGGFAIEQDKGAVNAEDSAGVIDSWGTSCIRLGNDNTTFIPASLLSIYDSQGAFNIELGYGFDALTTINKTSLISETGGGGLLDTFVLDVSLLGGTGNLRKIIPILSNGRCQFMTVQYRNRYGSQPFAVHPYFISEEIIQ